MAQVLGIQKVKVALGKLLKDKTAALERGLLKGGRFLQRESQKIVPVDSGNLKNTANTRSVGTRRRPAVTIGYGTDYALFVHEDLKKAHGARYNKKYGKKKARGAKQQAKFLEKPLHEKSKEIAAIVVAEVRKG